MGPMESSSIRELLPVLTVGAFGLVAVVAGGVLLLVGLMFMGFRRRRSPSEVRQTMLGRLGYVPESDRRWWQPVNRTKVVFYELPDGGWRWTIALTRYNTLTLQVEEAHDPARPLTGVPFSTGIDAMDERFLTSSEMPAQCMALASHPVVVRCMLAMPFLSMHVRGDELVIEDLSRRGMKRLLGQDEASARPDKRMKAEAEVHQASLALATVILDALYTRTSGTLFAEHR
jgi:hypothetical protein